MVRDKVSYEHSINKLAIGFEARWNTEVISFHLYEAVWQKQFWSYHNFSLWELYLSPFIF